MAISFIRTVIVYLAIVVAVRVMGKRQLGQLEPSELVVAVLISDLASHPLQDPATPLLYGLVPVVTLLCVEILVSGAIGKSVRFRSLVCGRPSMLIENGRILQREMRKNRVTVDELAEELRKNDILDIASVKYAILETDGTLSTLLYAGESPVTPRALNMQVQEDGYPVIVINEGRVMSDNLKALGKEAKWLMERLRERKISDPSRVYLMNVDGAGHIYLAARE